jgi:transposase
MVRELEAHFEVEVLLAPRVEDWVGPRHLARFVREFVGQMDLPALGFTVRSPKATGRPGFTARLLLCAWVYGYLTKQRSTRNLERACQCDMGAIWLTGNHQPDHTTLHNFFRDNRKAFKKLLKESALLACRMGLVDMKFVAIDGTKLKASASKDDAVMAKDLSIALAALESEIEAYMAQVESAGDTACDQLPESLADTQKLRETIARDLAELKQLEASEFSPVDCDARMMQTRDGIRLALNAQAAVDAHSGIVLASSVTSEANDSGQLNKVLDEVEANMSVRPDLTAVDTGYFSGDQIQTAEDEGRDIAVAMHGRAPREQPLHSWLFVHDPERDLLVCPIGGELSFRGEGTTHGGKDTVRRYRCDDHELCPFAKICSKDKGGRVVEVAPSRPAVLRQWKRQKREEHRENMRKRGAVVERIFGHIKRNLGVRQLEHRGLEAVEAVWATLLCVTNLRTIYKSWAVAA